MHRAPMIVIFFSAIIAHAAEPYDFRGAKLGTPLSEFKQLPFPDSQPSAAPDNRAPAVICTGDLNLESLEIFLRPRGTEQPLGVVKCTWVKLVVLKSVNRTSYVPANINVAGTPVGLILYYFLKRPDDTEPRLFRISVSTDSERFERIAEGLKQRFGPPTHQQQEILQNRMGAKFPSTIMTWRNDQSRIHLAERSGTIDRMALSYRHEALADFLQKESEKIEGKPGDKM